MDYECWPLGDRALLLHFGDVLDLDLNARVHVALERLREPRLLGVRGLLPSYASISLELDLTELGRHGGEPALLARIQDRLQSDAAAAAPARGRIVEIPTRYGGENGPDLDEVARLTGLTAQDVVALHCGPLYRVAQVGFQPGFPYLLGLPAALELPRRAQPRVRVAAGSIAIAGGQTGIYPNPSPGGWHLLGRTELALFEPARTPPALLRAGDQVRFIPVEG